VVEEPRLVLLHSFPPGSCLRELASLSFESLHDPSNDVLVDTPDNEVQLGAVEGPVVADPARFGAAGDIAPGLFIDQHTHRSLWRARDQCLLESFEDQRLQVTDSGPLGIVECLAIGQAQQIILERTALVEGQQEQPRPFRPAGTRPMGRGSRQSGGHNGSFSFREAMT
jgi:hypothetical protein